MRNDMNITKNIKELYCVNNDVAYIFSDTPHILSFSISPFQGNKPSRMIFGNSKDIDVFSASSGPT